MICFFFLPARPDSTTYLTEKERSLCIERMSRGTSGDVGATINKSEYSLELRILKLTAQNENCLTFSSEHVWAAFQDWRVCLLNYVSAYASHPSIDISNRCYILLRQLCTGVHICFSAYYHQNFWQQYAYSLTFILSHTNLVHKTADALAQLLTVPPYAVAAVVLTISSYASDRLQSRGLFISAAGLVGGIGYMSVTIIPLSNQLISWHAPSSLLLTVTGNQHVRYFATFCIVSGTYTIIGITIAWCTSIALYNHFSSSHHRLTTIAAHNLGSESKRAAGIPLYMAIGQCGSVLGSHIYPSIEGPKYMCVPFVCVPSSMLMI